MSQLLARGGRRLTGEVTVQGAKNSVLPILAATLLTGEQVELRNCPHLRDVEVSIRVLETLGCHARWEGDSLVVDTAGVNGCAIPDTLTREMRSSALFLGAVLARLGRAELSYPGGCDALWDHRIDLCEFAGNGR
jgi:UDP-N-acetylglucosamine 1-carboxyvinyltransferase